MSEPEPTARGGAGDGVWPAADLVTRGWELAEATLASAASERTLVTHWFVTGEDDSVNADEHFGSDERTLRFLGVALPTLVDQLGASLAVVVVPWDVDGERPTLTVVALAPGTATAVATRAIVRVGLAIEPPFWRLATDRLPAPEQLAAVASGLGI